MVRRGWGEGSLCRRVVKRGEREYVYWRVILPRGTGRGRREFQSRSERVARAWLKGEVARLDRGLPPGSERVTLGAYAVGWLKHTSLTVRPSTLDFYRAALRHLEPVAAVPVAALSPAHVRDIIERETASGRSSRTVRGVVQTLALVLRQAMADGIVERNVAQLVRLPKLEQKTPEHFTAEQARRFLEVCGADNLGPLYAVALGTGLRRGELLALTWRDVDTGEGHVLVRRGKTDAAARRVALPEFAALALRAMERAPGPIWQASPAYVSEHFKDLCRAAGVPVLTFHSLRHSAASLMLDAGVDPLVIQQIMGHTKVGMTGWYARAGDELKREAVERLGGEIAGHRRSSEAR